jgi:hypothetical protein
MKFKTVREGQQAVILNHMGEGRLVEGPHRVCIDLKTTCFFTFFIFFFLFFFEKGVGVRGALWCDECVGRVGAVGMGELDSTFLTLLSLLALEPVILWFMVLSTAVFFQVFLFRKRFQLLKQYSATSDEYLVIQENDGTVSHKPG